VKEYRPPKGTLAGCLACAALFAALGGLSVAIPLMSEPGEFPHPIAAAVVVGSIWFGMMILSIVAGIIWHTERIVLGPTSIELHRWGRRRVLEPLEVTSAIWRKAPTCGLLVLRASDFRFDIAFEKYKEDRREIADAIHRLLPDAVQDSWPEFFDRYFPNEAEAQRRREGSERPIPKWVFVPLLFILVGTAAALAWFVVQGFGPGPEQWIGMATVTIPSIALGVQERRRRKRLKDHKLASIQGNEN
jgi:hypothetical protein